MIILVACVLIVALGSVAAVGGFRAYYGGAARARATPTLTTLAPAATATAVTVAALLVVDVPPFVPLVVMTAVWVAVLGLTPIWTSTREHTQWPSVLAAQIGLVLVDTFALLALWSRFDAGFDVLVYQLAATTVVAWYTFLAFPITWALRGRRINESSVARQ